MAKVVFRGLFHLLQHARGNLRGRHLLAVGLDPGVAVVGLDDLVRYQLDIALHHVLVIAAADQAFDREQRVRRVGNGLAFCRLACDNLVVFGKCDDRRRGTVTFAVLNDPWFFTIHYCYAGVGGTKVNTDNLGHCVSPY